MAPRFPCSCRGRNDSDRAKQQHGASSQTTRTVLPVPPHRKRREATPGPRLPGPRLPGPRLPVPRLPGPQRSRLLSSQHHAKRPARQREMEQRTQPRQRMPIQRRMDSQQAGGLTRGPARLPLAPPTAPAFSAPGRRRASPAPAPDSAPAPVPCGQPSALTHPEPPSTLSRQQTGPQTATEADHDSTVPAGHPKSQGAKRPARVPRHAASPVATTRARPAATQRRGPNRGPEDLLPSAIPMQHPRLAWLALPADLPPRMATNQARRSQQKSEPPSGPRLSRSQL